MKISVVGAGNVGASTCYLMIAKEICSQLVLLDINRSIAKGKAIDMMQASIALISKTKIKTTNDYSDIVNSDIVIITAGLPRKDGMSREDLLNVNIKIMEDVILNVKKFAPNSIVIVVSNPLDAMNYAALRLSGFDKRKVIGMGGILDSARMAHTIVKKLDEKQDIVRAMVIGSHSEHMVPLFSQSFVGKRTIKDIFDEQEREDIIEKTKNGGAHIVKFLQTSAYYAPAASICILVEAISKNQKSTLPCSTLLEGEYGESGVSIGVPVVIGKNGIEKIVELPLDKEEMQKFKESVAHLRESLVVVDKYLKNNKNS
ncbi:MAG: malate dehydrogenase [Campylobacteraceae bacterium]|jgi:malate dehydrogenase|nr:malate dehydrogenase [Campylobacteraceae bacterium]